MCASGHHRTLANMSNGILIGLTDQEKTWITIYYKFIVLLKNFVLYETSLWNNVWVVLNFWCCVCISTVSRHWYEVLPNIHLQVVVSLTLEHFDQTSLTYTFTHCLTNCMQNGDKALPKYSSAVPASHTIASASPTIDSGTALNDTICSSIYSPNLPTVPV